LNEYIGADEPQSSDDKKPKVTTRQNAPEESKKEKES